MRVHWFGWERETLAELGTVCSGNARERRKWVSREKLQKVEDSREREREEEGGGGPGVGVCRESILDIIELFAFFAFLLARSNGFFVRGLGRKPELGPPRLFLLPSLLF